MKHIIRLKVISLLLIGLCYGNAQTAAYTKGEYLSIEELVAKKPSMQVDLKVVKRDENEIKATGGNDYMLKSYNNSIPKKTIKKEVLAFSNGKTLYLNCFLYGL